MKTSQLIFLDDLLFFKFIFYYRPDYRHIISLLLQGGAIQDSKQGLYAMTNLSAGVSILKSDYLVSKLSGQYTCEASNTQGSNSVSTTLQGTFSGAKKSYRQRNILSHLNYYHSPLHQCTNPVTSTHASMEGLA